MDCCGPQRATSLLVPLAMNQHRRRITARYRAQVKIADPNMRYFIGSGTGVVKENQYRMVPTALFTGQTWRGQQRVHLFLLEVAERMARSLFALNRPNLSTPLHEFWI